MQPTTAEIVGQRPDGAVRSEVLGVQHAEVLRHFIVLAHGVGDARAGIHARERGADQRQEHGEGLHQHEDAAAALAEEGIADDDHHVADGRRRARGGRHRVPAAEEVVRREILDQITERPLHQQRDDHGDGNVAFGVLRFAAHGRHRFESDQDQDGDSRLNEGKSTKLCTPTTEAASGWLRKLPLSSFSG